MGNDYVVACHDNVIPKQSVSQSVNLGYLLCFVIRYHGIADLAKSVAFLKDSHDVITSRQPH